MRFNDLHPARGARQRARRVGRGGASGLGKTAGRGQKGQRSRTGRRSTVGFEGGQMPLQRRLPKFGFASRKARFNDEVRLDQLEALGLDEVDLDTLKNARLVGQRVVRVKVIASGTLERSVRLAGIGVTRGARAAIEAAGGSIAD